MGLNDFRTRTHNVKAYPSNFQLMKDGTKPFDVRLDDRLYEKGDIIVFKEWDPDKEEYTGQSIRRQITCKQIWEGLSPGYCALGLAVLADDSPETT